MQRDMDRIRGKVVGMAALAERALESVLRAFASDDRQLAYTVILRDQRIDELEKEIDRLCLEFIVRQQPVARHLRFAYITIKINQELERIGDYAESIARQVLKLSILDLDVPKARFEEIASLSIPMLRDAVRAFVDEDAELARRTMIIEEQVDGLKSTINAELFQLRQDGRIPLEALTPLMTVARRFERVTDQAKNICEEVIYMTTGEYSKHTGAEVWRMFFVDDDNSCVSQMAEAIGNALQQPQFVFASAGVTAGTMDRAMVEFMQSKGIDLSHAAPRSLEQAPNLEYAQIIVALSEEARRAFATRRKAVCLDWSAVPLPQKRASDRGSSAAAYEETWQFLYQQISDLCEAVLGDKID